MNLKKQTEATVFRFFLCVCRERFFTCFKKIQIYEIDNKQKKT